MLRAELDGSLERTVLTGSLDCTVLPVGSTVRTVLTGAMVPALLDVEIVRTVVDCVFGSDVAATAGFGAAESTGGCVEAAVLCGCAGVVPLAVVAVVAVVAAGAGVVVEIRPPLFASFSFVITGVFDALRFDFFAAATSGESCALA